MDDPRVVAAIVGAVAGLIGGLVVAAVNIYVARRSLPFSRVRLKADLEILEKARQLNLDDAKMKKWLQDEINYRYDLSPHRKD